MVAPLDIFQGWLSKAGFRQDQARGKGGKWIPEGGTKNRRAAARQKEKQLAARREADRARGRRERAAQRRASGEDGLPPRSAMIVDRGGTSSKIAIAQALSLMPRNHFDLVAENTKFVAMKDFNSLLPLLGMITKPGSTVMAFFYQKLRTVFVPDTVEGMSMVDNVGYALHEAAHALDFAAGEKHNGGFYISEQSPLAKILTEEYDQLPPIKEYYAEHYKPGATNREIFAELYSATFNPSSPRKTFMGMLSAREVRVLFPRSVDYIKNMRVP